MKKISIVVPCYNEEESLPLFYKAVDKITDKMKKKAEFEFVFVNDGSRDKTLEILRDLAKKDKRVRYISFSRNFGKEAGMFAGLENATGDYVTTMDADLQDPPELLEEMFDTLESGDTIVVQRRVLLEMVILFSVNCLQSGFMELLENFLKQRWFLVLEIFV